MNWLETLKQAEIDLAIMEIQLDLMDLTLSILDDLINN